MSTPFFFASGLLIALLVCLACSSMYHPVSAAVLDRENNDQYYGKYHSNEEHDLPLMVYPKSLPMYRLQRSSSYYPRASRNSWFRVSTYQHMKPTTDGPDDKTAGDNLMRWG